LKIGQKVTMTSKVLKEKRILNIYLPQDYDKTKSYPVMYILDGSMNKDFLHLVGLQQFLICHSICPILLLSGLRMLTGKEILLFIQI
jgi:predicted alpha/beta superfamily hydrolase